MDININENQNQNNVEKDYSTKIPIIEKVILNTAGKKLYI